jgi:ribosome recycling factor
MEPTNNGRQMTKWVQKCLNINYPHYCQLEKNVEVELKNSKTVLRDMAADILVQVEQEKYQKRKVEDEKQDVAEKYQKRKVKDDVCKDCDKIHSVPTPNCRLA